MVPINPTVVSWRSSPDLSFAQAEHTTDSVVISMEKHSSLDIGIAQAREKTLPKSKDEQNPKNHTAKSASEDELGKVPLQSKSLHCPALFPLTHT